MNRFGKGLYAAFAVVVFESNFLPLLALALWWGVPPLWVAVFGLLAPMFTFFVATCRPKNIDESGVAFFVRCNPVFVYIVSPYRFVMRHPLLFLSLAATAATFTLGFAAFLQWTSNDLFTALVTSVIVATLLYASFFSWRAFFAKRKNRT
ncbi:MAG: hypothetical protein A3D67_00635 [Candidatus Lloydbacteria bacterium RIFCSPHIGHO2_02_FULL_51_22]|uniref:Uncharacterized protein n=1 Tax=Candidatus Lloydbacteria bacterium RIFCSPHIGHO2_02_FULL_51_22 TaxID=1798663 RepID=A0A1G2DHG3_9BACT|nr:MAG: hypothetical protein A3D67_00635 [Candidatus Lloydbacteria bacterium RIFCSPHIGHO2_02_FULL_51_22]